MTVEDLSPSAKYVASVVQAHEEISRQALLEETDLAERTLDDAIDRLEETGVATRTTQSDDARRTIVTYDG